MILRSRTFSCTRQSLSSITKSLTLKDHVSAQWMKFNRRNTPFRNKDEILIFLYIKNGCTDWAVDLLYSILPKNEADVIVPPSNSNIYAKSEVKSNQLWKNYENCIIENGKPELEKLHESSESKNPFFPSQEIVHHVLKHLFRTKKWKMAFHLINSLYVHPLYPKPDEYLPKSFYLAPENFKKRQIDDRTFRVILAGLADARFLMLATRLLLTWPKPNRGHFVAVIKGFLNLHPPDYERAAKLFKEMKRLGYKPNLDILTCLFKAFCKIGKRHNPKLKEALDILDLMRQMSKKFLFYICKDIGPKLETYTVMLQLSTFPRNIKTPSELINQMKSENIEPDLTFYNALLEYYLRRSETDDALNTYKNIIQKFKIPNVITLNLLLNYFRKTKNYLEYNKTLKLFEIFKIDHSKESLTTIMLYNSEINCSKEVLAAFGKMIGFDFKTRKRTDILPSQRYDAAVLVAIARYIEKNPDLKENVSLALKECGMM